MHDDDSDSDDSIITITGITGDTVTLPYTYDGDTMWSSSSYTINDNLTTTLGDVITGFDFKPEVTVGNTKLTEEKLNDLLTLLDLIEQDPELKSKLDLQKAINKLKE